MTWRDGQSSMPEWSDDARWDFKELKNSYRTVKKRRACPAGTPPAELWTMLLHASRNLSPAGLGIGYQRKRIEPVRTLSLLERLLCRVRSSCAAPLAWHHSSGAPLHKSNKAGPKGKRVVHVLPSMGKQFFKVLLGTRRDGWMPPAPADWLHGYIPGRRRESAILIRHASTWRLERLGLKSLTAFHDLTNAFGSVKWEAMDRAAEALLGPSNHFLGQQRYRLATTTIPGNDGNISLKIGEGGLMGDPLMVALFWVSFLPSTIRWQQLVAEEGAESGQLLAWHPWSGERMDPSLSQYADDTTKQIVAMPGEDVQALAKRVQCSNDVFERWQLMVFHRTVGKRSSSCIWWEWALSQIVVWCVTARFRCQAKSSQWRGISAASWEKRHPSLMSSPGGVKPQWRLSTQLVSCGTRAGCRGDSNVASSSVVWSTRHFLASRLSVRRSHSTKLSRLW